MANPTSRYSTTYRVAYRFPFDGYRGELGDAIKRRSRSIYGVREGSQEGAGMITITAAELATLREKAAEADELRKALLALKEDCQTSNDCQYGTLSTSHVARIVDAAIAQGKGE